MARAIRSLHDEIAANEQAFAAVLPELACTHRGHFALMRHGEILGLFDDAQDAYDAALRLCGDGMYSIHEIERITLRVLDSA